MKGAANADLSREELVERLNKAEARIRMLEDLIGCIPGVVWDSTGALVGPDRRENFIGQQVEALLGYSLEEWMGTPNFWMTILHPEDAPAVQAGLASGEPDAFKSEHRLVAKDGRHVWVEPHPVMVRDASGAIIGTRGVALDITARKEAERDRSEALERAQRAVERLDGLIDSVPGVIWESYFREDAIDGPATFVNDYVETMTGYSPEEWLPRGDFWLTVVHPEDRQRASEESKAISARGDGALQFRCITKGGAEIWVESHMRTIQDEHGNRIGLRGVWMDITSRKQVEHEQAAARLREEVIRMHEARLAELSTPLIPISDEVMVMPLIGAIDSGRAGKVIETLLTEISRTRARVAILDITGVPSVDTEIAAALARAARAVQLVGAQVVLTGIRPEVAQTLVHLDADLTGIVTLGSLQSGIAYAMTRRSRPPG